jgi:deoxycytidine triphosphate deaminase
MYLSDRDIRWAVEKGTLIIRPTSKVDPTSIDLHLDRVDEAQVWDTARYIERFGSAGNDEPEVHLGTFHYGKFSGEYLTSPPDYCREDKSAKVCRRGSQILVRSGGFLLWQTKEEVGTPLDNAQYICFVDGKSTKARAGIIVHLTAPTIHAGWSGKVVLEIANLGPLTFVLQENDVIAQLTVATISSIPQQSHHEAGSSTLGQINVKGAPGGS